MCTIERSMVSDDLFQVGALGLRRSGTRWRGHGGEPAGGWMVDLRRECRGRLKQGVSNNGLGFWTANAGSLRNLPCRSQQGVQKLAGLLDVYGETKFARAREIDVSGGEWFLNGCDSLQVWPLTPALSLISRGVPRVPGRGRKMKADP
jgi:hypothetical protein